MFLDKALKVVTKSMSMSDGVWEKHANPWSGWTRFATYPFLILAFWSRDWLDLWFLIPVAVLLAWIWINPRIFPKPKSINNWMSKVVFGERIFTERKKKQIQIPKHHVTAANIINAVSAIGLAILIYGLIVLEIWPTFSGAAIALLGKLWFVDRMAWLYKDMENIPEYGK